MKGKLLLLPNSLSDAISKEDFSISIQNEIASIDGLIAEDEKEGRRFLKCFNFDRDRCFRDIPISLLNEHTKEGDFEDLLTPLLSGKTWGLISDAGLPCIADPGAKLVAKARQKGIEVETFPGLSSIIYALMLSGFPAQSFAFHGYFPKDKSKIKKYIKALVLRSQNERAPQIFIEAPYRSHYRLEDLIKFLPESALLCVAWDLTMPTQQVITRSAYEWKRCDLPDLKKKPTVFIFLSN